LEFNNAWLIANCHLLIAEFKGKNGYNSKDCQDEQETQVLDPAPQPLQHLRTAARLPAQVRPLPLVLPGARVKGRDPRGNEVVVVEQQVAISK
jgi:hypothetical protein